MSTLTKTLVATVSLPTSTFINIYSKEQIQVLYSFDDYNLMTNKKKTHKVAFSASVALKVSGNDIINFVSFLPGLCITQGGR